MFITIMDEYLDLRDTKKKYEKELEVKEDKKIWWRELMSPRGARGRNGMPFF